MKTKKQFTNRILSLVLALVMVLGMLPTISFTASAAETEYDGVIGELYYKVDKENNVTTIFGNGALSSVSSLANVMTSNVVIEEGVTSIGNTAFRGLSSLEKLTVKGDVTIGNYAFQGCASLETITFMGNVTSVGRNAFYGCASLTNINYYGTTEPSYTNTLSYITLYSFNGVSFCGLIPSNSPATEVSEWNANMVAYSDGVTQYFTYNNYLYQVKYTNLKTVSETRISYDGYGNIICLISSSVHVNLYASDLGQRITTDMFPQTPGGVLNCYSSYETKVIDTSKPVVVITCIAVNEPTWSWNGTASATATFIAKDADVFTKANATISSETVSEATNCQTKEQIKYTATVTFNGQTYTDTKSVYGAVGPHSYTYTADDFVLTETCANGCGHTATATLTATDATYTGSAITTDASVTYSDGWAGSQEHGEITYSNNLNAGTATAKVMVEGKELTTTFEINEADISGAAVTLNPTSGIYTGTAYNPSVSVTLDSFGTLVEGTDYTLSWNKTGFTNADTYTVTVTGEGNFEGTTERTFTINAANLADVKVEQVGTLTYTGEAQTPVVSANATVVNNQPITFTYSTEQNGTYGALPSFENAGIYTVYYKATAPNHNAATGSFEVKIDKATVTGPTIESKPYNGETQTADVPTSELYTVTENNGGVNAGKYNVVLTLNDSANYKWSTTDSAEVTLQFVISAAENSWTTAPSISGWTYGETANAPVYEVKFGTVYVLYYGTANDGSDYSSEYAPTKAGNYTVQFNVTGTPNYSSMGKSVNFTIAKADYDMSGAKWDYTAAFDYDGYGKTVTVIGLPSGVTVSGYEGNTATVVGNYTAKVTFSYDSNNYNAPTLADLAWSIKNDWTPTEYVVSTPNDNGWLNDAFTIIPAEGYWVSLTNTADSLWDNKLTYSDETANGSVTFYLKNADNGKISLEKTVTYKIDKTAPTGKVEFVDRTGWEKFVNSITFGLFYKDEVTVKITANDDLSGVANVEYYAADKAMTLEEVKAITDWTAYNGSFGVSVEDTKQFVYFVRITDNAGNVTYLSTNGAEYDTTAPVISGIENGKTYYTTQKVTVTEKNVASITLNGEDAGTNITLDGNKDTTYTIVVTDKAGNSTTVTVTMKPISDLSAPIDSLNKDNVNSGNEQVVDEVKAAVAAVDTTNATEQEKAALKEITDKAAELEKVIDDTKAEIARINEELNKHNADTVNSDDAAALEQLGKDIKALTDGGNLTDAERTALSEDADDVAAMQKTVADTKAENDRISDAVDGYDLATVTSDDKADLEQLLADINEQLQSTNLTEEEISELNGDKKAVEDLLTKIKGTDELIDKLTEDVGGYNEDTVKSTDKDAIEQIIEDIDALLETENLTDAEEKALEDAKTKAEGLLDAIEDAAEATTSENTEKVKDVTAENVTPENKTDLEKAKEDLEKALEDNGGNYTDDEKKAIEDEIKRIDDALEVIENVEEVEELIGKLPENITKNDENAIKAADDAYNALTDYEKSLVDTDAKKALDDAKATLAELNKPADTNSPQTGDNSNMMLWIALLFISGGAVIALTVVDRKRRMASKR